MTFMTFSGFHAGGSGDDWATVPRGAWSSQRWQDWAYLCQWLLDDAPQGQEQLLWDAAELAKTQVRPGCL